MHCIVLGLCRIRVQGDQANCNFELPDDEFCLNFLTEVKRIQQGRRALNFKSKKGKKSFFYR